MSKLRNDDHFKWFRHSPDGEVELVNSKFTFLRTNPTWTGATIIEGAFVGLSLRSKQDRAQARAFAEKILTTLEESEQ